jgi:hypothetical protein
MLDAVRSKQASKSAGITGRFKKNNRSVNAARIAPNAWKVTYGRTRSFRVFFANACANVTAGLICAPECLPSSKITNATVPPKTHATNTRAIVPLVDALIMTEPAPKSTRR